MIVAAVVALHLVVLHSLDGREVHIAPEQVTSLHASKDDVPNKNIAGAVRCVVGLTDGKFVSVLERCDEVKRMLEQ